MIQIIIYIVITVLGILASCMEYKTEYKTLELFPFICIFILNFLPLVSIIMIMKFILNLIGFERIDNFFNKKIL